MAVVTFVIDYIETTDGYVIPVYCRENFLYVKIDDAPHEYYEELKSFLEKYPDDRPKPRWEGESMCIYPYEVLFFLGGAYRGTLNNYMSRFIRLQDEINRLAC